jgi:CO/xanthine dehydrogenase FAD-binding subunit
VIQRHFEYHAPTSIDEAVDLVASVADEAAVISGGTWVVPEMTHGVRLPRRVVDLRRAGLGTIRRDNGSVVIGTTVTYADVLASAQAPTVLRAMAVGVTGGAQVHNQGTLGGSACYANPASDVPGALVGLGATLRLARAGGARDVAAGDFFVGDFETVLEPGELLTEIVVPAQSDEERTGYYKFKHCESSWPIATACCTVDRDGGVARLVLGGVSAAPVVVDQAVGATSEEAVATAVSGTEFEPWNDVLAEGWYRRRIAGVVAKRAYLAATG